MVRGKTFPTTSGVGHTLWAEAEAAFFWPSFLPIVTTRLAHTTFPTSQLWSWRYWPDPARGSWPTPWFGWRLSPVHTGNGLLRHVSFYGFLSLPLWMPSKGLIDTNIHFGSSSNIWPKGLFLSFCRWQYYFSAKFCRGAAFQHLLPIQMVTSCHFSLFLSPHHPPQKGPLQPPLIIGRDCQGWWHSHPPSASSSTSRLHGTSHAFSLAFMGPTKGTCCCCPAPAMPQTHLSPDLMQVASQMHWDARTLKVGLDLRRHWPWRHILTVQRGRTVWANPTLSQPLSSLFLFPDLNQCLFFSSSQQHGIWFPAAVPIPPPPPAVPALHLLGTSDTTILSLLWKNPSQHYWDHWDPRWGWREQTGRQADLP